MGGYLAFPLLKTHMKKGSGYFFENPNLVDLVPQTVYTITAFTRSGYEINRSSYKIPNSGSDPHHFARSRATGATCQLSHG